jgi:hypothetical protein
MWFVCLESSEDLPLVPLNLASAMRGRMMLRILAALSLTLLLYNALVVQFWVRPQSSSSLLPRPNARFASTSHSIVYPSPILTSESSSFIMNLPPPLAAVTASPAATSLQIGAHLAGHTDPPSNDASCNHVRNPSFENRYAAIALSACVAAFVCSYCL